MDTGRGKPSARSPGAMSRRGSSVRVRPPDRGTCEIVIADRIKTRHFCSFAAVSAAPAWRQPWRSRRLPIPPRHPSTRREIGEIRTRAERLHDRSFNAHGDKVDADRLVPCGFDGDLHLVPTPSWKRRARVDETRRLQIEQRAEPAEISAAPGAPSTATKGLMASTRALPHRYRHPPLIGQRCIRSLPLSACLKSRFHCRTQAPVPHSSTLLHRG